MVNTLKKKIANADYSNLRLKDRIRPGLSILFVGINPGVRSALTGHHFAGFSNRFWKLLHESGLTPQPLTYGHDDLLPTWNLGITNLIARPTPGISDLGREEYVEGWKVLERKIRKFRPKVVALVGVTVYRAVLPLVHASSVAIERNVLGPQPIDVHGATFFVLPNPSGRNANFTYREMLDAYIALREWTERK